MTAAAMLKAAWTTRGKFRDVSAAAAMSINAAVRPARLANLA